MRFFISASSRDGDEYLLQIRLTGQDGQIAQRLLRYDMAMARHDNSVAQRLDLRHDVAGKQHTLAFIPDAPDHVTHRTV